MNAVIYVRYSSRYQREEKLGGHNCVNVKNTLKIFSYYKEKSIFEYFDVLLTVSGKQDEIESQPVYCISYPHLLDKNYRIR